MSTVSLLFGLLHLVSERVSGLWKSFGFLIGLPEDHRNIFKDGQLAVDSRWGRKKHLDDMKGSLKSEVALGCF